MKLSQIQAKGFRSLENIQLDIDPLTVLIGENDSGKSSVLDLLDIFHNNRQPDPGDFQRDTHGNVLTEIQVTLTYSLEDGDDEASKLAIDNNLKIRKLYSIDAPAEIHYWGERAVDPRLTTVLSNLTAQEQKELILDLDSAVANKDISNQEKRTELFETLKEKSEKVEDWIEVPRWIPDLLPRFERYSSMDYNDPANIVAKTLRQVYEKTLYEEQVDGEELAPRRLIKPLRDVQEQASNNIIEKVTELESYIKKYNTGVHEISYDPIFDFEGSLRPGEFLLNSGHGLHALSRIGDGTKRRMFMAVTDWDREVTLDQSRESMRLPSIIRGYDEPDTNLHYDAQRLMYHSIADIVADDHSRTQAILCTHSLTMIDRAPAQIIRIFSLNSKGCTCTDQLDVKGDPEIEAFLENLARELGITNSIMFYERCFILIEGDTEENALPILYRRLHDRSMVEDCIRIINVKSNSAVREFLKLMWKNRKDLIIIFVDSDSENSRDANLTRNSLNDLGYEDEFIDEHLIYIGDREFEDAFSDIAISRALQSNWQKADGSNWQPVEIEQLRESAKFSDALRRIIWEQTSEDGAKWSKPIFGRALAETCEITDIPEEITRLFNLAQKIAGL